MVVETGKAPLSECDNTDDHGGLRWKQRRARQAVEARVTTLRQRNRFARYRDASAARHEQMEQDRTPSVCLHHPELARQAAGEPSGHRAIDWGDDNRNRPE